MYFTRSARHIKNVETHLMRSIVDDHLSALVAGRLVFDLPGVGLVTMNSLTLFGLEDFRA